MYRLLNVGVLALAGILVACAGAGDIQTTEPAGSPVSTPAGQSPGGSPGTAGVSPECNDSFAALAEAQVSSISELGDLADEVEPTLEACESIEEWIAAAGEVIADDVDPDAARMLLGMHCDSPELSDTLICEELASS
jgi:hypothetical protein